MAKGGTIKRGSVSAARSAMKKAVCDCAPGMASGTGKARNGFGPGAHAVGVDPDIKAANLKHLKRIEGQVRGLQRMVDEDTYCIDVLTQVSAINKALQSVAVGLLDEHVRHCVRQAAPEESEAMITEAMQAIERLVKS